MAKDAAYLEAEMKIEEACHLRESIASIIANKYCKGQIHDNV
jgi:hypothetical protein